MRVFLLFFMIIQHASAQNLVINGGFEEHGPLNGLERDEKFAYALPNWKDHITWAPFICDTSMRKDSDRAKYRICPYEIVKPYAGKVMLQLGYEPNSIDGKLHRGNGPTITCQLRNALELGKQYRVSFWIYIHDPNDPEYVPHIGFQLYPKAIRNPTKDLLNGSPFTLTDSQVVLNHWFKASWTIRPLCNLQYLAIGVFRNSAGPGEKSSRLVGNDYFIDEVSVEELHQTKEENAIPFCYWDEQPQLPEEIEPLVCYFDSGDSTLNQTETDKLDSFILKARKQPSTTFYIFGHTDSVGTNHEGLSSARIRSTLSYSHAKGLASLRFIALARGKEHAAHSNQTEAGRALNRRVQITQARAEVHQVIYRQLLDSLSTNQLMGASKLLSKWIQLAPKKALLYGFHDPRLEPIKKTDRKTWQLFQSAIQQTYQNLEKKECAQAWDSLYIADQWYRTYSGVLNQFPAFFTELDSLEERYQIDFPITDQAWEIADSLNQILFCKLISTCGYPNRTEVGKRPASAAFLLLQHNKDLETRKHWLSIVYTKCMEGEAEWVYYANMYDRIAIDSGLPQRYGTQFRSKIAETDANVLYPLENPDLVNQWRKEIGLVPLQN
jgi:outer membrane protein OmpA-like peptidoglycan-associated protein